MIDDITIMNEGVHANKKLDDIPDDYFIWYYKNVCPTYMNQYVHDYIKERFRPNIQVSTDKEHL